MICPYCHQEHPDGYKFCPNTGNIIEHQFKACTNKKCTEFEKHILPLESKFCPNCGHPIDTLVSNNTTKNEDVLTFDINGVSKNIYSSSSTGYSSKNVITLIK